jgi:hypothetical protein
MFELDSAEVKCISASTNAENKGKSEDTRLGMSLYFEFLATNDFLDKFDPKLRQALYNKAAGGKQEDLTGHTPERKFPITKIEWPYTGDGYEATIHAELNFGKELELQECKVDKFTFTFRDGAAVGYKFRIYCHPELDDVGKLAAMEKHTVRLTLTPPAVGEEKKAA